VLCKEGAKIKVYDPQAMKKARKEFKNIVFCADAYAACRKADCLLIATEWDEFKKLDLIKIKKLLKRPLIIDGRNLYEPGELQKSGFHYVSVGRRNV
jgi:UDPglucose 6-dehydrogenase